ncbi:MAG: glycoside hydrolase family 2 TIM barrel-domain containing protein, partial [Kiritimatiellae bacterium]|nr:glycoside hydrolase family 2 TIM barrel-domain containing protein [Kiritimatiellia bacterium]
MRHGEPRNDRFAQIAAEQRKQRQRGLTTPAPLPVPARRLPLSRTPPAFTPVPRLRDAADLRRELARMRRRFQPFLRDLAPALPSRRLRVNLREFDWRLETAADRRRPSFLFDGGGRWERVALPHYGGPLGRATAWYRTPFNVTEAMFRRGALFVRFRGVDYKAHVFVNGAYLGSHEGFCAPFEFDFTAHARCGRNVLLVKVENDAICMGNDSWGADGAEFEGDKLYAATGPGFDEPEIGWHHCPPGMGIYQDVAIEARAPLFIHDLFVRPLPEEGDAEAWIEVWNSDRRRRPAQVQLSLFGQNFRATVFRDRDMEAPPPLGPGVNFLRFPLTLKRFRWWAPDQPWLYQLQVRLLDGDQREVDTASRQFGMRSFRIEEQSQPKGKLYLNSCEIRLRGANTMGFEQRDVIRRDWEQLRDDILLAKIANMNFLRLTQRPVQDEVYDYCDRLGLMTQTDLPLFGVLRRNQFAEAVRQAGEMERLIRAHPCNVMVSYINEPFPAAANKPHRHLLRAELESFFRAADEAVRLANPDRAIKAVDGDYDPPGPGLSDNHCYCGWYNGHGVELGKLHKGYWQPVRPCWHYACGEFGAEGLDPVLLMRRRYPASWLPHTPEEERDWTPSRIPKAQTGRFHTMWFDTPHSLPEWSRASQAHQAWATRLMTEAFRRDTRMNSCAIHLFIDAFPSGWMKSIMDVERQPKPAYFAYREALTPLLVSMRTDRLAYFGGEAV